MSDNKEIAGAQGAAFDWRKDVRDPPLSIHPAATLFPRPSETELKELAEDIKINGQRVPIAVCKSDDGMTLAVVDGVSRLDAMALTGLLNLNDDDELRIGDKIVAFTGITTDPYEAALSLNIHRRHLTAELKHRLIAEVLKAKSELSNRQIGKLTKTDKRKVQAVRAQMESTGAIAPVEKTVGKDGKARKKPVQPAKPLTITERRLATKGRSPGYDKACAAAEKLGCLLRRWGDGDYELRDTNGDKAYFGSLPDLNAHLKEIAEKPMPAPAPARVNADDIALEEFNAHILRLIQQTKGAKPQRFLKTAVPTRDLNKLAVFLTELVALKKLAEGDDPEASADQMKAKHAALDEPATAETAE